MINKPKPRLFFNCPLKALWMMKEFGCKLQGKYDEDYDEIYQDEEFYEFEHCGLGEPEMIEDLIETFKHFRKIYVAPESEEIFLPKLNDVGITANGDTCHFDGEQWLVDAGKRYVVAEGVDIIFRGKQFFDCEREND